LQAARRPPSHADFFQYASVVSITKTLARTLNSLVRVSRRVNEDHSGQGRYAVAPPHSHTRTSTDSTPHEAKNPRYRPAQLQNRAETQLEPAQEVYTGTSPGAPRRGRPRWNPMKIPDGPGMCQCRSTMHSRWVHIPYHSAVSRTFNSLFKVLCIFRSLYLCAISLVRIFSLRRAIPPV
jgi:hypothetical protein